MNRIFKIDSIENYNNLSQFENFNTVNRRFITNIIRNVNFLIEEYNKEEIKIYINKSLINNLIDNNNFIFNSNKSDELVGLLYYYKVYASNELDFNEYYIGFHEKEISIFKRYKKINKILGKYFY